MNKSKSKNKSSSIKESRYTSCDAKLEFQCGKNLSNFVKQLQSHLNVVNITIKKLYDLAERLWVLSTKYVILTDGAPSTLIYPIEVTEQVVCEIINEKHTIITEIVHEINEIYLSWEILEQKQKSFELSAQKLDWKTKSEFIEGNEKSRPLDYFINGATDMLFHFNIFQSNIKHNAFVLDLINPQQMKDFQECLNLDQCFLIYLNALVENEKIQIKTDIENYL